MERRSAGAGERASAEWIAERLRNAGAEEVRVEAFRYQHTFGWAHAAHAAAGLAAAAGGARPLAAAALASFELDYSGRSQWLRRVLPADQGANVTGRVPARGERRRTVALVAHHDAAHTGLMWHPRLAGIGAGRAARTGMRASFAAPAEAALALTAITRRPAARALAATALGAMLALSLDVARGATVPGASDNATGVAAVLALVERFAADPLPGTEVVALAPGCEESGMGGMAAWLRAQRRLLDPRSTLVLGLDTLGAGEPVVLSGEGPVWTVHYRPRDLALADRGAARAGVPAPRRFRIGGWTDPVLARLAGLPAVSLLSVRDGGFTNYHLPSDTPDRVDWGSVDACLRIAAGVTEEWAGVTQIED